MPSTVLSARSVAASASLLAIATAVFAAPVFAQDARKADNDVVVVTGFRKSYADAVKTKRDTLEISDSISSDGLGRFPDLNVGEAIQRIPGIQINREADSRNATINLRGLPGTFARTTLNGVAFADPILNGSTPLGAFNSDIFSSITVIKSPTAADQSGGLSGNIDLRIAPALGRKEGGFIKASTEYDTLGKLSSPSVTLGINHHFSPDFAVFGVIAAKDEKFRRDSIFVNTYGFLSPTQVGNGKAAGLNPVWDTLQAQATAGGSAGIQYPSQMRQVVKYNSGHLVSGATGFEWKVSDNLKIGTTAFYTRRNLEDATNDLLYVDTTGGQRSSATGTFPSSTAAGTASAHLTNLGQIYFIKEPNGTNAYINRFDYNNAAITDSRRSEPAVQETWSVNPSVEFKNAAWRLSTTATVSRASSLANQIEIDIVQNPYSVANGSNNGVSGSLYTGGSDLQDFAITLNTPTTSHINPGPYTQSTSATQLTNPQNSRFGLTGTNGRALNTLNAVQADAERFFNEGFFLSSLQFGARYEQAKYTSSGSRNTAQGTIGANVNPSLSSTDRFVGDFFGNTADGYTKNWVAADIQKTLSSLTPVTWTLDPAHGVFLTPYGLVNNSGDTNFSLNNFSNANDISAAYVLAKFKTEIFGVGVRGSAGLRYEDTENTIGSLDLNPDKTFSQHTYKQHYDNTLPSLIVVADLTDTLVLRFAGYSTYVRPQPRDITPTTQVTAPTANAVNPTFNVTVGSTALKPYTADSLDMSLEWYNRPGGLFAIDVFQKKVDGYIGNITDLNVLCPSDGLIHGQDFGLGHLTVTGGKCVSDVQVNTAPVNQPAVYANAVVNISGKTNLSPLTVKGVELVAQQNLDFLPGFWKNFGGSFNYAYTTIEGKDQAGNALTLPGVSKNNINLIGYYETKKFGVRLVYNWRDKYDLAAGNTFVGAARTVKARSQLDFSASYNVNKSISISVDGFNLTDATRAEYENDPMKPRRLDYDGRTYQVTLRASF